MSRILIPRLLWCSILFLGGSLPAGAVGQTGYRPEVGKLHVDFTLPRIDNRQPLTLSDFRGQKVLLFHFASW